MNRTTEKRVKREPRSYFWIVEVLIFVTITPALVHSVTSLQHLPPL